MVRVDNIERLLQVAGSRSWVFPGTAAVSLQEPFEFPMRLAANWRSIAALDTGT